jgi:ABC-type lipoprotein export system ATPase subunit
LYFDGIVRRGTGMKALEVNNLNKTYITKGISNEVIGNITFSIEDGKFCAIMGPSGSGKTTLLNLIAGIDNASKGRIIIGGTDITNISKNEIALFRRDHIGVVYQDFNLIDSLDVKENIILPMHLEELSPDEINETAEKVADVLGIRKLLNKQVYEISGGERQRTAICRAVINNPGLLLADEPTGNLDSKAACAVMESFVKLNRERDSTIIMVTHDAVSASYSNEVIFFKDGMITNRISRAGSREIFYKRILAELDRQGDN